jgi:hypothetical protein
VAGAVLLFLTGALLAGWLALSLGVALSVRRMLRRSLVRERESTAALDGWRGALFVLRSLPGCLGGGAWLMVNAAALVLEHLWRRAGGKPFQEPKR